MKSILNLANHSKLYEVEKSCFQMAPTCCIFVLSRIVMPSRGQKCLKIYYSRLEDRALTKELVVFLGSSPRAKNLLKRVVNRVIPAATLLHAPRRRRPFQISPQRVVEVVLKPSNSKKKVCRAPEHAILKLHPKLHFTQSCIPVENL